MSVAIEIHRGSVLIDEADVGLIDGWSWWRHGNRHQGATSHYARGSRPDPSGHGYQHILMHKLLTGWALVDHRNGNGLDNRRENLREATPTLNAANRRKPAGAKSRYKGVSPYIGYPGRWVAYISSERKRSHLGCFDSEVDAALAYDQAARRLFGDFAAVNFPRLGERSALAYLEVDHADS